MFSDIKYFFKISFPTLTMIFLTFLNLVMSNQLLNFGQLFVFQAIFFWLLFSPKLVPLYIIVIIGILQDIIYISPIGSTGLIFLFLIFLFEKYNKFFLEPSFFELLISFLVLFVIGIISLWALNSTINLKLLVIKYTIVYEILLNFLFFPISYFFLHFCFKKMELDKKL